MPIFWHDGLSAKGGWSLIRFLTGKRLKLFLCELYQSVQGEGLLTGTDSVFVRTSGCNLRCTFCDTPYSSWDPEGSHERVTDVVPQVIGFGLKHVVITGGEPMIQRDLGELTRLLKEAGQHITIETAGTVDQAVSCDLISISPKLSNSTPTSERAGAWHEKHEASRHRPDVIRNLLMRFEYQLKFVVAAPEDIDEVKQYLTQFPEVQPSRVLLMPEGVVAEALDQKESWIRQACDETGFQFCPRMHIVWYGNQRGT